MPRKWHRSRLILSYLKTLCCAFDEVTRKPLCFTGWQHRNFIVFDVSHGWRTSVILTVKLIIGCYFVVRAQLAECLLLTKLTLRLLGGTSTRLTPTVSRTWKSVKRRFLDQFSLFVYLFLQALYCVFKTLQHPFVIGCKGTDVVVVHGRFWELIGWWLVRQPIRILSWWFLAGLRNPDRHELVHQKPALLRCLIHFRFW